MAPEPSEENFAVVIFVFQCTHTNKLCILNSGAWELITVLFLRCNCSALENMHHANIFRYIRYIVTLYMSVPYFIHCTPPLLVHPYYPLFFTSLFFALQVAK